MGLPDVVAPDEAGIARAAALVQGGQVVAYPTETLYGLGVDALCATAVDRLVQVKGRDAHHPLPVLVTGDEMLEQIVAAIPDAALTLMRLYWPGPLTLVLPARGGLPAPLVSLEGCVGVRVSSDPVAAALVASLGRPLTATSANLAGDPPATCAAEAILAGVFLVLDGGARRQPPSTVVQVMPGVAPRVLRQGGLRLEAVEP